MSKPIRVVSPESIGKAPITWFDGARYGLFCHYTFGGTANPQTITANGTKQTTTEGMAAAFDADTFAANCAKFGVEYVIFTAWHYAMNILGPNAAMDSYLTGHTAQTDAIQKLITALRPYGIKLLLYVHLTDGNDLTSAEQTTTGWNDSTGGYATWNTFVTSILTDMGSRYGTGIDGYWIDMVQSAEFQTRINLTTLKPALLAGNARRVIVGNGGNNDDATPIPNLVQHRTREYIAPPTDATQLLSGYSQVAIIESRYAEWWATAPASYSSAVKYTPAEMFRYTVLQAGTNTNGGGTAWAIGPYAGKSASIWEPGLEDAMTTLGASIAALAESIKKTRPSTSWVTPNTAKLSAVPNGFVATTSADASKEYIHVLTPPTSGKTVTLPAPSDVAAIAFEDAYNLATGSPVTLQQLGDGSYAATLASSDSWSTTDTVIVLRRRALGRGGVSEPRLWFGPERFTTPSSGTTAVLLPAGAGSRFPVWQMGPDTPTQVQCSFRVPDDWNSFSVEMLFTQLGAGTGTAYFTTNRSQVAVGSLLSAGDENPADTLVQMSGTVNQLSSVQIMRRRQNTRGALNHIRVQRFASNGSDTGPTLGFLGLVLVRST
ncbi:alpha-L-fucosidase [Curtobacterium sp. 18060]|uniref:alpha-L-fucosidase n=1 Tax=Curtobacterium sp. 18060 TaxID=2681408 RepID=UPI00135C4DFE|nr:alpha-L-fucosidase [Curtobacterium sp. 18060]